METLSSSISTFKAPFVHPPSREAFPFRTLTAALHPLHPHLAAKPNSSRPASKSRTASPTFSLRTPKPPATPAAPAPETHRSPASGYAAALVDIARCRGALDRVRRDVRRLSRLLKPDPIRNFLADPMMGGEEKAELVKELGKRGGTGELLMGLVKVLAGRNRVGVLAEVLMEFERICDEMLGTQLVLVPSAKKMEGSDLIRIARSVHRISGAATVKVRNLVDEEGIPAVLSSLMSQVPPPISV
ncbi:unnamed protein product [Linum tenue]|uniref:ATP synthase delta chain n=1 Tax=Linum tenue TaxID=586396 RepID=A0AAV0PG53_9ROSI|nr:unnamed protein product [Linum tenue]